MIPPPNFFLYSSYLSLKLALMASRILLNSNLSSFFTVVKHKTDAVFLWTIAPNRSHIIGSHIELCLVHLNKVRVVEETIFHCNLFFSIMRLSFSLFFVSF